MQITIEGTAKEIADLVSEVQNRLSQNKSEVVSSDDINAGTSTAPRSEKKPLRKTNFIPDPYWSLGTPWDKRAEKEALRRNRHHL